jgi:hypothetical protein
MEHIRNKPAGPDRGNDSGRNPMVTATERTPREPLRLTPLGNHLGGNIPGYRTEGPPSKPPRVPPGEHSRCPPQEKPPWDTPRVYTHWGSSQGNLPQGNVNSAWGPRGTPNGGLPKGTRRKTFRGPSKWDTPWSSPGDHSRETNAVGTLRGPPTWDQNRWNPLAEPLGGTPLVEPLGGNGEPPWHLVVNQFGYPQWGPPFVTPRGGIPM